MSIDQETNDVTPADPLILLPAISYEKLPKTKSRLSHFSGIFYSLLASFLFTSSTFVIKELKIDLLDAMLLRFFLQTSLTLIFAFYKDYALLGGSLREKILQILCAATGVIGLFLFFVAVRYVELPDVITLSYTRVVWTVIAGVVIYHERPSIGILIALPMTLLGVVFVTQPSFFFSNKLTSMSHVNTTLRYLGLAMAFTCALTSTANVLLFKQLISTSKDIKPSVLSLQFSFAVLISLIINQTYKIIFPSVPFSWNNILNWRYGLSSFVCIVTIIGSVLIQKAIKREHPAIFSLLGSADIIFALILQNLFTSTKSNVFDLIGSALVIGSVVLIGISKITDERRRAKENPSK